MLSLGQHTLTLPINGENHSEFNYVWLRDNCACEECLHPSTQERTLITAKIPDDIAPAAAKKEGEKLFITWNDKEHTSEYSFDWLHRHSYPMDKDSLSGFEDPANGGTLKLWGKEFEAGIPTFDYKEITSNDNSLLAWCEAIRDVGLTIVRGAPTVEGEIERFAEHVGCVREVIYDRLHYTMCEPRRVNTMPIMLHRPALN